MLKAGVSVLRALYGALFDQPVLIHTPKCGGTYLMEHYGVRTSIRIRPVGHASVRSTRLFPRTRIVGLIRNPVDWYASYYWFCKKSLCDRPQSITNFPDRHPITLFSLGGKLSFDSMVSRMRDSAVLEEIVRLRTTACIYGRDIDDVFAFMLRTRTGFWTWTMLWHFWKHETRQLRTKVDVLRAAREISRCVEFIHQENIDEEARAVLQLGGVEPGEALNRSLRPTGDEPRTETRRYIAELDGEVAAILGGYRADAPMGRGENPR